MKKERLFGKKKRSLFEAVNLISLLKQSGLAVVETNRAFLTFLDLLLFVFENLNEVRIQSLADWDSPSENVELVSLLQLSDSYFDPCDCNCFLLAFLYGVYFNDLCESSFDPRNAVSFSFQSDVFNLF